MRDYDEEEDPYDAVARYREEHPEQIEEYNRQITRAMNIKLLTDTPEKAKMSDEALRKMIEDETG